MSSTFLRGWGKQVRVLDVTTEDGDTLVIDTIGFEPYPSGLGLNVPSSPGKHTVERLTLTPERTRLRYETTVEGSVLFLRGWRHSH